MLQPTQDSIVRVLKSVSPFLFVVSAVFFAYELWLFANSFSAVYNIYTRVAGGGFTFWGTYWLTGELFGEVSLILRFAGACCFLAFAFLLLKRKILAARYLGWGVLLEGIQYLFFLPFISYLYLHPYASVEASWVSYKAASSYIIQLLLITPTFLLLFLKLRKPNVERQTIIRWTAVAAVAFLFALWTKHFIFSLYALPIHFSFEKTILLAGSLNSTFTLLVAVLVSAAALSPAIRGNASPNWRMAGMALCIVSVYFAVYLWVALTDGAYMSFIALTELWAASTAVVGVGFIYKSRLMH